VPHAEHFAPSVGSVGELLGSPSATVDPPVVPVDLVREHLVRLRAHDLLVSVIAERAGVSAKTVTRVLQRRVQHVQGPVARALFSVTFDPDLASVRVPVVGTTRRLRWLCAMGWSLTELSDRCVIPRQTLSSWCHGRCLSIPRADAETIREIYDELYDTDGPCEVTRAKAERSRWDRQVWLDEDIDDPQGVPLDARDLVDEVAVRRVLGGEYALAASLSRQEAAEVVCLGTLAGASQADLADDEPADLPDPGTAPRRRPLGLPHPGWRRGGRFHARCR
jgi:transcriptional regulator with XRE-family HTH domain